LKYKVKEGYQCKQMSDLTQAMQNKKQNNYVKKSTTQE